ncbi:cytochrome c oxidase subunit 7C, mitochondrial-like [Paramacrobiotus metropolitanus]|nr:cytochrome c oxidase subunit 7C, mitochondrial-like [Paramacrobiotus metropolitanus]
MLASRLFTRVFTRTARGKKNFSTSKSRRSGDHHDEGGNPGENLPFDITNRYKFTLIYTAFFASGFGLPFLVVRHQLMKKNAPQ